MEISQKPRLHKDLTPERWFKFSRMEQLANVGCDVIRAIQWKKRGNLEYSNDAFMRALELLTLTILDPKNKRRGCLRELCRMRETLVDHFMGDNEYNSTDEQWFNDFNDYSYAAAVQRGR